MASVQVHLFAAARAAAGVTELSAEPGTIAEILDAIIAMHPPLGAVRARSSYLVDGVSTTDEQTAVPAGGRLDVLPPFAGG